jgi:hypothetical protein
MPHDWENARQFLAAAPDDPNDPIKKHELYCTLCAAIWDPVPDGKEKLL